MHECVAYIFKYRDVLNSILNPNLPLGEGVFDPEEKVPLQNEEIVCDEEIKKLDKEAVSAAEAGDMKQALEMFNKVKLQIAMTISTSIKYDHNIEVKIEEPHPSFAAGAGCELGSRPRRVLQQPRAVSAAGGARGRGARRPRHRGAAQRRRQGARGGRGQVPEGRAAQEGEGTAA